MVAMGKALGNGYPISCLAINRVVSGKFEKDPFRYAQSHQNDALGCRVGLEVISILEEEGMVEISSRKGDYLTGQLLLLQKKHPANIKEVRGRGLMTAIELASVVRTEEVYMNLIEKGFLVGCRDNVLRFMPPLTIELAHIDSLIAAIDELIE
jgi:acetylornithine aminotransferase